MIYQVAQQKLIYIVEMPDVHKNLLKIGETTLTGRDLDAAAHKRIKNYTTTAGIKYNLLHTELAVTNLGNSFSDRDVHRVLERSGIKKVTFEGTAAREWFKITLIDAVNAIKAVKQGKIFIPAKNIRDEIIFRDEQKNAIERTVKYFKGKNNTKFLWNAKMRFGKTLCALEVVRRMNFAKTIIVTHRPVVNACWFDDFGKIFGGNESFNYGSKDSGSTLEELLAGEKNFVYFASMQDLRGSDTVGGKFDKNFVAFKTDWNCVIVDEAHEGTQTALGDKVIGELVKPETKFLALSGTPFNIIDDFDEESVYTWDYISEQRAKAEFAENFPLDHNPYEELPQMNIYTYDLGKLLKNPAFVEDKTFNFREFFRTDGDKFVHAADVKNFLDLMVKRDENNYPFSREEWREMFRHTFWIVPGVEAGKALSNMLKRHKIFGGFEIVNVAGDGDPEDKNDNALKAVQDAIKNHPYTITISCGKLTAGVTVPEWSAVFMLAGSYSTSAMNYLQTIFRVQSPCRKGGVIKTNCYVFDFAPDRTLKMVAESVAVTVRAGRNNIKDNQAVAEFLKFCPVIALRGSQMKPLKTDDLFRQLKRAYAERVVRNGFEDRYLYDNDKLLKLTELDLPKFENLRGIIGTSKAQEKTSDITINNNGLTDKERKKLTKELKREPTLEEIELRRKQLVRRSAISILRGISIRMPLLIYGADVPFDDNITIEKFADLIDDESWQEFMPKGVTKELFGEFIQYYDRDVFIEAGNNIRERAKVADELKPTERVKKIVELFNTFKNPDKETVLTPWRVVNLHLSAVFGGYDFFDAAHNEILDTPRQISTELFTPDKKILEINSKTGLYPLYVAYSIYRARLGNRDENNLTLDELRGFWDAAVADNVFVICKTPMAEKITRRTLIGYRGGTVNAEFYRGLLIELKDIPSRFISRITQENFWHKGAGKMFFDGVVGNPPYQKITGTGNFAAPVYNLFMETSFKLADKVSLIHPARCLFNAGATPQDFRNRILNDPHLKVVRCELDSKKFFPSSDIKGGVAITLRDANENFGAIGTFIPFDELNSIHRKVVLDNPNFKPLSDIMFASEIYHFTDKMHEDFPDAASRLSEGHAYDLKTSVFEKLPDIFLDNKPNDGHEYIQILGLLKLQRVYKWIRRDYVNSPAPLTKFKIIVPHSNGSGALGEVVSTPLVGSPLVGSTQTFISVGAFDTRAEADACIAYIRSKFCRVMLGILKVTQHNPPQTWSKVPMQDFTADSDIDWNVSIAEIDAQLYRKYNLSTEEIEFIESKVKAMD